MTAVLAIIEFAPSDIPHHLRPNIGETRCAIQGSPMEMTFYFIPLISVNGCSIFFIALAALNVIERSSMECSSGYTRFDSERNRFMMYLRLFAFMTVLWSFEIISSFLKHDLFIITDILNCLQGFVIFVIFVLQRNTRNLIIQKINAIRGIEDQSTASNSEKK
jgi:G protein-coupled receptor Mth (Methuselah protein)